jgi:hypothetical protein
VWWWIDLAIVLVSLALLVAVGFGLYLRVRRFLAEVRAVAAQLPTVGVPGPADGG